MFVMMQYVETSNVARAIANITVHHTLEGAQATAQTAAGGEAVAWLQTPGGYYGETESDAVDFVVREIEPQD